MFLYDKIIMRKEKQPQKGEFGMKTKLKHALALFLALIMVLSTVPITALATDNEEQTILETKIENVKFDYKTGEAFQASATVTAADRDKYDIEYECWQEFEGNEPVAAWYSDGASHGSLPALTSFESNKKYVYSIMLKPRDGYTFSIEVTMEINGKRVSTVLSSNHLYAPAAKTLKTSKQITSADIENVRFDYEHGDTPQASAEVAGADTDKYTISYECWVKKENVDEYTSVPTQYWYSDDSWYQDDDVRLNTFDKDGKYDYSIRLKAKDGYCFSDSITSDNITLNGKSLPDSLYVLVLDEGESCLVSYGSTIRTIRPVEEIRLNGAAVDDFVNGESPRFTGWVNSAYYDIECQSWEEKDNRSVGISSVDSKNAGYSQLITGFEYGKVYIYGIGFTISDSGLGEGYRFDKNTKLYINDKETALNINQTEVSSNGTQIKFKDILTMTPQASAPQEPTQPTVPEQPTSPAQPQPTQTTTPQVSTKIKKPKKVIIKKVKGYKKALEVKYSKVSGISGYQIQVATDKKFKKNKKTVTAKKSKTKVKVKKLKKKKKYYVRVRAYKTVSGKKVYGAWSKVKTVKTK